MVHVTSLLATCLLTTIISAAPTGNNGTVAAPEGTLQVTVNDILNSTPELEALADLSFKPINAGSNKTIIAAVPDFAAPVLELPSIKASIASLVATATESVTAATATATSEPESGLSKRRVPPESLQYWNLECNNNPSFPEVNYRIWQAAIRKACRQFFDPSAPYSSPLVYLYEGSHRSVGVGPPAHRFWFTYHVRELPAVKYDAYYAYTADLCIADLESRLYWALGPDSNGWAQPWGYCFDTSGISSEVDDTSPIWYEVVSPSS